MGRSRHGAARASRKGDGLWGWGRLAAILLALCLALPAGGALAEGASQRPKPRPAVEATTTEAPQADTPGEADGAPTEDGVAVAPDPAKDPAGATDAPPPDGAAATESPALAAPATATAAKPAPTKAKPPPRDPNRGPITNLPMPRFVSLKGKEGNARRGPGLTHRIDWVFVRAGMPLRITGEYEHWRRIEDAEGAGGWVHFALLSGVRSAQVIVDFAEFHSTPDDDAAVSFKAEKDVIGWIQECSPDWCRLSIDGEKGWVRKTALWGVDPGEVVE